MGLAALGCSGGDATSGASESATITSVPPTPTSAFVPAPTTIAPPTTAAATTVAPTTTTTAAPDPSGRVLAINAVGTRFATADGIELVTPSAEVEMIGYHEANHDGTRQMEVRPGVVPQLTLDSRERNTQSRSAADVVVNPELPVFAPVTGRVLRAGQYTLYCDNLDSFVVIEPVGRPGFEVKILHILASEVSPGDQVVAGVTRIAPGPTPLPFESQVDEFTAGPSWPHVHIEVVDTSIRDIANGGSGSDNC